MPKPNGWDDFARAGKQIKVLGPCSTVKPPTDWTKAELDHFMRSDAKAIAILRQGLAKPYRHPRYGSNDFPPFGAFRELARTLTGAAYYYEMRGEFGRAMHARLDCLTFGCMLPRGAGVLGGLVGQAICSIGSSRIARLLPRLEPAELAQAANRFRTIHSRKTSTAEVFREEADLSALMASDAFRNAALLRSIRSPWSWVREDDPFHFDLSDSVGPRSRAAAALGNINFAFANKTRVVTDIREWWIASAKRHRGPYKGRKVTPPPANPMGMLFCQAVVPTACHEVFAQRDAVLALLEIEIALRRHRIDGGSYPARLSLLKPKYLDKIPYDPFGGKSLCYRTLKNGQGFVLYSIGPDLKDNGGKGSQHPIGPNADILLDR